MQKEKLKSAIESILFAMGGPVELKQLESALEENSNTIIKIIEEMQEDYKSSERGICINRFENSWQLCTKQDNYDFLIKIVSLPKNYRMTDVQLETLSIIAYKQPVTKADIEKIRGVSSDHAVNRLMEAGLIEEVGRLDSPGRPMLFGTTREFLRRFGLCNTEELPDINSEKVETFRMEAEEEVGFSAEETGKE